MRTLSVLTIAVISTFILASCQGSVSTGSSVSKAEAEKQAKVTIAQEVQVPVSKVPPINCPGDLKAKVGAKMVCQFGPVEGGQMGTATLTVDKVDGDKVGFKVVTAAAGE